SFVFTDRYGGGADEWGKGGRYLPEVKRGRVWESNFIADLWGFQPKDYKERGGDNRTTLFEFVDNTMSAHLSEFPVGKYKKAHRPPTCRTPTKRSARSSRGTRRQLRMTWETRPRSSLLLAYPRREIVFAAGYDGCLKMRNATAALGRQSSPIVSWGLRAFRVK